MKTFEELKQMLKETENPVEKAVILTNIKAVVYSPEVIDSIIDAFNVYIGKPIGEKTEDKIKEAVKKIDSDLVVWFKSEFLCGRAEIIVYSRKTSYIIPSEDQEIKIMNHSYDSFFDADRKFKGIDKANVWISGTTQYYNDIPATAKEIETQYNAVIEAVKEYDRQRKVFEGYKIIGIEEFNYISTPCRPTKFY